jgi:serine/threonine protein kinase
LLGGYLPFGDVTTPKAIQNMLNSNYEFLCLYWNEVSLEAQSFINELLNPDPEKRISATEALNHPWVILYEAVVIHSSLIRSLVDQIIIGGFGISEIMFHVRQTQRTSWKAEVQSVCSGGDGN